jgi:uncharacterized protein YcbX
VAHLARILIFPVKSLEPIEVPAVKMLRSGALDGDRALALFDAQDNFVNGKRFARIHLLRSKFDRLTRTLSLASAHDEGSRRSFHVDHDRFEAEEWLSEFFAQPVYLKDNPAAGFPDDTDCPGPTVISTATLEAVAGWFPGLSVEQTRLRFRANLELDGVPPFWEDRLYAAKGTTVRFRIGDVNFDGNNPCQRCAVPPRDPFTGANDPDFMKRFNECREKTLPAWAERSRFNHFYRLSVNTLVPVTEAGKVLRVGDSVTVD